MNEDDYTVDELLALSTRDFYNAVADDLHVACDWLGPFQDERVIRRTLTAMTDLLGKSERDVAFRSNDPKCPPDLLQRTKAFRSHVLFVISNTQKRLELTDSKERQIRRWKQALFEVVDALIQGWDDEEILALEIPYSDRAGVPLTVEEWHAIRLSKDPNRKRAERVEVSA
jgi:hypothetical protein